MTVVFMAPGSNFAIHKTNLMSTLPHVGETVQIKKKDYKVQYVKWFFNDNPDPVVNIIIVEQ